MKLNEFVDRLYAMGGIEIKPKRSLDESYDVSDELFESLTEDIDEVPPNELYTRLKNAINSVLDDPSLEDEYDTQTIEELRYLLIKKTLFPEFELYADFTLTEAKNPENDEVNAIIRNHLGKRSKISKKEQEVLDRYGISRNETGNFEGPNGKVLGSWGRKTFYGPEAPVRGKDVGRGEIGFNWASTGRGYRQGDEHNFDAVDYANYLTKETPGEGTPSQNDRYYNRLKKNMPGYTLDPNVRQAGNDMTPSELTSLQPYSAKYKDLQSKSWQSQIRSRYGNTTKRELDDIQAFKDYKKEIRNKIDSKKNESLNESNFHDGSLRDEFYSLIEGMDPQEVISWLLSYINDYDLDDLIKDARKDI